MSRTKLIYTSYSPNTREKDLKLNFKLFFKPSLWKSGNSEEKLTDYFRKYFPDSKAFVYNYARSALYHFFSTQKIEAGEEIIFQGFTCTAAVLPAIWAGLAPRYCDIEEESLCLDIAKLQEMINDNTRYIVAQHTLGLSPNMRLLRRIADENDLILIEDCTHYLPFGSKAEFGHYGDISIFSFGRDKVVSGVDGGVLLINEEDLKNSIENDHKTLPYPSGVWTLQRVLFPILWWYIKKYYFTPFGKLIHLLSSKLGLLTKATSKEEKAGEKPDFIPCRLPNALAILASEQLNDIDGIQDHRRKLANYYSRSRISATGSYSKIHSHPPLRYPLRIANKTQVLEYCYNKGVILGNWYSQPISPMEIDQEILGYHEGSCPISEAVCNEIINLPTHINMSEEDCDLVIETLKSAQE